MQPSEGSFRSFQPRLEQRSEIQTETPWLSIRSHFELSLSLSGLREAAPFLSQVVFADPAWTGHSADNKPVWCELLWGCSVSGKPPRSGCWGTHPHRPPRLPYDLISALWFPALVYCIGTTFILNCNQLAQKNWTQSEACLKFSLCYLELSNRSPVQLASEENTVGRHPACRKPAPPHVVRHLTLSFPAKNILPPPDKDIIRFSSNICKIMFKKLHPFLNMGLKWTYSAIIERLPSSPAEEKESIDEFLRCH